MENRSSSGSSRPFSVNNPFRNAAIDSSINQYKNDSQFQEWARNQICTNSFDMPQLDTRTSSQLSFPSIPEGERQRNADQQGAYAGLESFSTGSLSPSSRAISSKNPFLDIFHTPVSYTHLDVYKRQHQFFRLSYPMGLPQQR